jgi:hypothetical protein
VIDGTDKAFAGAGLQFGEHINVVGRLSIDEEGDAAGDRRL